MRGDPAVRTAAVALALGDASAFASLGLGAVDRLIYEAVIAQAVDERLRLHEDQAHRIVSALARALRR